MYCIFDHMSLLVTHIRYAYMYTHTHTHTHTHTRAESPPSTGSIPERDGDKLVFNPEGEMVVKYRKVCQLTISCVSLCYACHMVAL